MVKKQIQLLKWLSQNTKTKQQLQVCSDAQQKNTKQQPTLRVISYVNQIEVAKSPQLNL